MARAKEPGKSATTGRPTSLRDPQIRSWESRAVLLELDSRSIPAEELLSGCGFTRADLEDPEGWVPLRRHHALFIAAAEASGDPAFAFAVGARIPYQSMGVLGHVFGLSKDVREGFEAWSRFSDLVVDDTEFGILSTPVFDAIFYRRPLELLPLPLDGMSFAGCILAGTNWQFGPLKPVELLLTGPASAARAAIEKAFGAPIRYGAKQVEVRLPPGTLDKPLKFSSPSSRAVFVKQAELELAKRRGKGTIDRVRAAILSSGLDSRATVEDVASELGTTARTLQRWLADESLTFSAVFGDAIRDAAIDMLQVQGLPVEEVADRLGFSSRRSLHRAIQRWTGKTPAELKGE
ncbi:MAG: AraC family transcriptional regulator ligand-binding domain-containing protein [Deltaproteobacteria bacterium]